MNHRRLFLRILVSFGCLGAAAWAQAQSFPSKPLRLIVPFAVGGSSDVMARGLAKQLSDQMGTQVVVENRPGGGGGVAMEAVVKSAADGHTLLYGTIGTNSVAPVLFKNLPVDPVKDEAVGPAGPTTATRMDGFTEMMLAKTGLIAMIGKAERGPVAIEAIKKHKSAYLMAVGGAAYLVSKAIKHAKVLGFADMGMEAIYEFDVVDMPVTVAVDAGGTSAHITGPAEWQKRIATGEFKGIGVTAA